MAVIGIQGHEHIHLFHVVHGLFQLGGGFLLGHSASLGQRFPNGGAALQLGHVVLGQGDLYALGGGIVSVAGEAALGDLRPIQNAQHVVQHGRVVAVELLELLSQLVALQLGGRGDGGIGQRHPLQLAHHTGLAEKLVRAFVGSRQLGQHLTDVLGGGIDGFVAQNGAV